ncbi:MAG: hypothetical protein JST10_05470 [Bacteroidetes bacterium]|nr:hypothetical protein [Bacteroidota bacterium]
MDARAQIKVKVKAKTKGIDTRAKAVQGIRVAKFLWAAGKGEVLRL